MMVLYYESFPHQNTLSHHGILGQKWGQRNGPPYPLKASAHSSSENKAGWQKSLDKNDSIKGGGVDSTKTTAKKGLTDKQKRAIKIGAIAAATALVAIGAYELKKSGKLDPLIEKGKETVNNLLGKQTNKKAEIPDAIKDAVTKLNPDGSSTNCRACSVGGILRMRGLDVTARGDVPVGQTSEIVKDCFKGGVVDTFDPSKTDPIEFIATKYGPGSSGMFGGGFVTEDGSGLFGHALGWTVDSSGKVNFFDGQSGRACANDMIEERLLGLFQAEVARLDNLEINQAGLEKYFKMG